ncbi:MAG: hypothetical protein PVH40_10155 [Gemmatimonadales bacterium]|jgi:hypothetical protein
MRRIVFPLAAIALTLTGCDNSDATGVDHATMSGMVPGQPPVVTILDENFVDVQEIERLVDESFVLYGSAIGEPPLFYFWHVGVVQASNTETLNYAIGTPGEHVVLLEVLDAYGMMGSDQVVVHVIGEAGSAITIDVKPGSADNTVNLGSQGGLPVAVLSTADFDAATIDPATVTLAIAGVRVVGNAGNLLATLEDVNSDGLLDLLVHIDTQGLELESGDAVAVLRASTYGGDAIEGTDTVRIVPDA